MKRCSFLPTSALAVAAGALFLISCSTPQTRIGMSRPAVWLAWGSPDRRIIGNMGGGTTETWVYTYYASYPYYPYEPLDEYFGAPLYDPFCYSWFPPSVPYPGKLVTFAHGKAV